MVPGLLTAEGSRSKEGVELRLHLWVLMFHKFAHGAADALGTSRAFVGALVVVILWGLAGPFFRFSDSWQLVINTGTTIVTFLMVFLIQSAQNRDAKAIHLKLDELIRGVTGARNALINLQDLTDEQLEQLQRDFIRIQRRGTREVSPTARSDRSGTSG